MNYVMLAATVAENATKRTNWNIYSWLLERYDIANTQTSLVLMLAGVILCMVIPYLLGSINFAIIISGSKYLHSLLSKEAQKDADKDNDTDNNEFIIIVDAFNYKSFSITEKY